MRYLAKRSAHRERLANRYLWVLTAVNEEGNLEEFVAPTLAQATALLNRAKAAEAA
jgi:hypothetical protein